MNEVLNTIAKRFSCRGFDGKPVEKEKLELITKAALQAPSGLNSQSLRVVIVQDKALIEDMDKESMLLLKNRPDQGAYNRFMERGGKIFYNAPCLVLLLRPQEVPFDPTVDAGIMVQNIALAATSLDVNNIIVAMGRLPFDTTKADEYKVKVGWKEGEQFVVGILLGYSDGLKDKEPHEIDLNKITYID